MHDFMKCDFNISRIDFACLVKAGKGASVHRNRQSYGLALFIGGKRVIKFDKHKLMVEGSSIVYFPKGSNYNIINYELSDCYAVNFEFDEPQNFEPFVIKVAHMQDYLYEFNFARNVWDAHGVSYEIKIKSILYNIICKLYDEYVGLLMPRKISAIVPAIDYINRNFRNENISTAKLAKLCGFSEVYLRKLFSAQFGISPNRYIKRLKLQYAQNLLMSGLYKINEIGFMSGFNDESYFSREFKKYFGHSPGEYVKTSRE